MGSEWGGYSVGAYSSLPEEPRSLESAISLHKSSTLFSIHYSTLPTDMQNISSVLRIDDNTLMVNNNCEEKSGPHYAEMIDTKNRPWKNTRRWDHGVRQVINYLKWGDVEALFSRDEFIKWVYKGKLTRLNLTGGKHYVHYGNLSIGRDVYLHGDQLFYSVKHQRGMAASAASLIRLDMHTIEEQLATLGPKEHRDMPVYNHELQIGLNVRRLLFSPPVCKGVYEIGRIKWAELDTKKCTDGPIQRKPYNHPHFCMGEIAVSEKRIVIAGREREGGWKLVCAWVGWDGVHLSQARIPYEFKKGGMCYSGLVGMVLTKHKNLHLIYIFNELGWIGIFGVVNDKMGVIGESNKIKLNPDETIKGLIDEDRLYTNRGRMIRLKG